ncbi:MAG: hypothetical protein HYV03_01735, partial [Deltaproteobacteria bacterium]|nr:hypothetical protein [Deltaproteobacteria bacterium]
MTRRVWASLIGGAMIVALFGSGFLLFASPLPVSMLVARRQRLEALGGCLLA